MPSETRELILTLVAPANIQFAVYPGTTEEIIPTKKAYLKGEKVGLFFAVANIGDQASDVTIVVKDLDSGAEVAALRPLKTSFWTTVILKPAEMWYNTEPWEIGSMPDHDWRLEITVTP